MKTRQFFSGIILSSFLFISCQGDQEEKNIDEPIVFSKDGELVLLKPEGDTIKELDIEIADDDYEWATGLMYRESMEDHQGMLFIYDNEAPRSFYMKNTKIPLDILYFSADSVAVSFQENAQPMDETPLPSEKPAQFILEINGGLAEEWGLETGDKISFKRTN